MELIDKGTLKGNQTLLRQGWPTFYGAPTCLNLGELKADIAFLGVPLDSTTNDRPGSRFGPAAIRDASMRYQHQNWGGWLDQESGKQILRNITMADCGDVDIRVVDLSVNFAKITQAVSLILNKGAFPVLVGGDHAITFPTVQAFSRPLNIVYFDAHLDFTDEYKGVRYSHDNPLRRVSELPFVRSVTIIGIRGVLSLTNPYWEAKEKGAVIIPSLKMRQEGVDTVLSRINFSGDTYVSIDIDVLDPAVAPGTGYPEPGGISYYDLKQALLIIGRSARVVGFDLVEVSPLFDPTQRTTRTAARVILDFLGAVFAPGGQISDKEKEVETISVKGGSQ